LEKDGKTCWHRLVGETLKVLLEPVGIEVRMEVPVVPAPPVADLILIQRKEIGERGWTQEQRLRLADGLQDLEADQVLVELKITEISRTRYDAHFREKITLFTTHARLSFFELTKILPCGSGRTIYED